MRPLQENDVFHAIAHPARRAILLTLRQGEKPAGELAKPFEMSLAAVSQHLKVLKEADLVGERRDGRQRIYSLRPRSLAEVATWVDEFTAYFEGRLDALGEFLDRTHGKKPTTSRTRRPPRVR